jgi:predicted DNA-binding transcriptional regulator AlpA
MVKTHSLARPQRAGSRGHVAPQAPVIDITKPGRLRTGHVLALCSISHSTLYARLSEGTFPVADGMDGRRLYWKTETIRKYLET